MVVAQVSWLIPICYGSHCLFLTLSQRNDGGTTSVAKTHCPLAVPHIMLTELRSSHTSFCTAEVFGAAKIVIIFREVHCLRKESANGVINACRAESIGYVQVRTYNEQVPLLTRCIELGTWSIASLGSSQCHIHHIKLVLYQYTR